MLSLSRTLLRTTRQTAPLAQVPVRLKKKKANRDNDAAPVEDVDLSPYKASMQRTVTSLQSGLSSLRVSGAHPSMLDNVTVSAYGAAAPLAQLAQVSVRDARALVVSVFDAAVAGQVERAIRGAGLNLNPAMDAAPGRIVVPVPKPSKETREAMRKTAMREAEEARVAARHVRKNAMDAVKKVKSSMPADEFKRLEKEVQAMTDGAVKSIDGAVDEKVKSLAA